MSTPAPRDPLPVPRVARGLALRASSLAARDLDGLARREPHVLVHGTSDRVDHVLSPALETVGWQGPKIVCEPDPLAFARRVTAPSVEAAVLLPALRATLRDALLPLRDLLRNLAERVPTVLVDCPSDDLPEAYAHGFDLVTPPLHGIYPAAEVLTEALRMRALFRDCCGQGRLDAERPGGVGAPRGHVALLDQPGPALDEIAEQLIGLGLTWKLYGAGWDGVRKLRDHRSRYDIILVRGNAQCADGIDLLRLLRHGEGRLPPCLLHGEELSPLAVMTAWHAGAWAWASTRTLRAGQLADMARRGMNLSRARRRETGGSRSHLRGRSSA